MMVYLDAGSIHSEMMRRHPEIDPNVANVVLSRDNGPYWATLYDMTGCVDGPADIDWATECVEDYHGFQIRILKIVNVSEDYWKVPGPSVLSGSQ